MLARQVLGVGLSPGRSRTRCLILEVAGGRVRFLGRGEAPSRGWSKNHVADAAALAGSIQEAAQQAEQMARVSAESVVVGLGGPHIQGANGRGVYEFGRPREITAGDLAYAVELAARVQLGQGRTLLQVVIQDFTVDGRAGYRNPVGVVCSRLEANVHIITTATHEHDGVVAAVHQAHLAVAETVFEAMAAAHASILPEERSRGAALLGIGAQSTLVSVYEGEAMLLASTVPIGGDHFTRDIAYCLHTGFDDAERLKREYGCAILGLTSDNTLIEVPSPAGREPREASRRELNSILEARAEEMFERVRAELERTGMEQSLMDGVVLSGGGALLNGMCDMAERMLNCQARFGLPLGIAGLPEELNDPAWTGVAGLAMYAARLRLRKDNSRRFFRFWDWL